MTGRPPIRRLRFLVLVLAVGGLVALWTVPRGTGATAHAEPPPLTAGQIADAVLFNDGPAARYLADLRRPPPVWSAAARETQRRVHASIEADAQFTRTFVVSMRSGHPLRVRQAMTDLGTLVRAVLDDQFGRSYVDSQVRLLDRSVLGGDVGTATAIDSISSLDTGAAQNYQVHGAAWMFVVAMFGTPGPYADSTRLAAETMIVEIAWVLGSSPTTPPNRP